MGTDEPHGNCFYTVLLEGQIQSSSWRENNLWPCLSRSLSLSLSLFFWPHLQHAEASGPGLNLSHSFNLHHSSGNASSLTHFTGPGIESMLPQRQYRILTWCTTAGAPSFYFYFVFRAAPQHMEVPKLVELELQPQGYATATSATYTAACSNARSLTHWARPGIKPTSLRTLCLVLNPPSHKGNSHYRCYLFFFFPFRATLWHMEFPGQGSDLSHSCDLNHSCSNSGSLTHRARLRIEPVPSAPKMPSILLCHSRNSYSSILRCSNFFFFYLCDPLLIPSSEFFHLWPCNFFPRSSVLALYHTYLYWTCSRFPLVS